MRDTVDLVLIEYSMEPVIQMGSVEEHGYFAFNYVGDKAEQMEALKEVSIDFTAEDDFCEPGWYIIEQDDRGFVYGYWYPTQEEAFIEWEKTEAKLYPPTETFTFTLTFTISAASHEDALTIVQEVRSLAHELEANTVHPTEVIAITLTNNEEI